MTKIEDGGPAFARSAAWGSPSNVSPSQDGMSIRDWYRGEVIKGLLANPGGPIQQNPTCGWGFCNVTAEQVVAFVEEIVDVMISSRKGAADGR